MLDNLTEWLILLGVALLLFGGASKIPEFARAMGRAVGEFKRGQAEIEKELKNMTSAQASPTQTNQAAQPNKDNQTTGN
ncbi:MAG: twin-arginine translocase TatA/TatE family subunit [Nitrososphaerota archaeon]|nr:twin-arginine translocase TatA/TatE family subunit [Nitrososphaerota archaeon]